MIPLSGANCTSFFQSYCFFQVQDQTGCNLNPKFLSTCLLSASESNSKSILTFFRFRNNQLFKRFSTKSSEEIQKQNSKSCLSEIVLTKMRKKRSKCKLKIKTQSRFKSCDRGTKATYYNGGRFMGSQIMG